MRAFLGFRNRGSSVHLIRVEGLVRTPKGVQAGYFRGKTDRGVMPRTCELGDARENNVECPVKQHEVQTYTHSLNQNSTYIPRKFDQL